MPIRIDPYNAYIVWMRVALATGRHRIEMTKIRNIVCNKWEKRGEEGELELRKRGGVEAEAGER